MGTGKAPQELVGAAEGVMWVNLLSLLAFNKSSRKYKGRTSRGTAAGNAQRRNSRVGRVRRCGTTGLRRRSTGGRISAATLVPGSGTTTVSSGIVDMIIIILIFFDCGARGTATDRETAGDVGGWRRARDVHGARASSNGRADGNGGGDGAVRSVETGLN